MAPLIVITGPTASGKTRLAVELAERYNGEIVCADSRTVYKGMDIGTAKPTRAERRGIPHYLLDMVEPGERYSLYDFQQAAKRAIADIRSRGKVPFLVGGTGLYIDSVVLEYALSEEPADPELRRVLETKTVDQLQAMIKLQRLEMPTNRGNRRHLIRALEQKKINQSSLDAPLQNTYVVAITTQMDDLEESIYKRAVEMFEAGVVKEAAHLASTYGWENEAMSGNIYPILRRVIEGEITEQEAIDLFVIRDRQLVKRQITWLKRRHYVKWLNLKDAHDYLEGILRRSQAQNVLR